MECRALPLFPYQPCPEPCCLISSLPDRSERKWGPATSWEPSVCHVSVWWHLRPPDLTVQGAVSPEMEGGGSLRCTFVAAQPGKASLPAGLVTGWALPSPGRPGEGKPRLSGKCTARLGLLCSGTFALRVLRTPRTRAMEVGVGAAVCMKDQSFSLAGI